MVHVPTHKPENVDSAVEQAAVSHRRLVLLVGPTNSGKTALLRRLQSEKGWPLINLGRELSRRLLPLTVKQREIKTAEVIADMIQETEANSVLVDNTEIVFNTDLRRNADGLLRTLSRNALLVWSWQGHIEGDRATHAPAGHPEHVSIPLSGITVIEMNPSRG